ncbi:MAG: metallophosphoesterase family protein [Pseudomonadota bacterium]
MGATVQKLEAEGRLLVFGGPYSNLQATEALLGLAGDQGLGPEQVLCTGDLVAYCAEPQATVDLIRDFGCPVVMGNCEESLAADAPDCGCGFDANSACDFLSQQWYAYSRGRVSADSKSWMGSLPRSIDVVLGNWRFLAVHGSVASINEFIFPNTATEKKEAELSLAGDQFDGILGGHSGLPFAEIIGGKLWLNSGALGMPANDGTPRVWYALLELVAGGALSIQVRSLDYDHDTAAKRMRENGLDNGYAACLASGLWPSLDVLTAGDKARTGRPISEIMVTW